MSAPKDRRRRATRRRRGMSLVEVMIAMVIMAFGMLGVAGLQVRAITEGSSGRHLSTASALARNRVEELSRLAWDATELADDGGAWSAATTLPVEEEVYTRTERIAWDAPLAADVQIKSIEVRIGWSDEKRQNRQVLLTSARLREVDE